MKKKVLFGTTLALGGILLFRSLKNKPRKAEPVKDFDLDRFLGKWYEIARFNYKFEENIDNVIARYSLNEDGTVKVLNSGYNFIKEKWEKAEGIAKFRGDKTTGALKVSFYGPFYEGYNVIAVDDAYNYALIAGRNLDYLWILSREKILPLAIKTEYLKLAELIGYNLNNLVWVNQDLVSPFEHAD